MSFGIDVTDEVDKSVENFDIEDNAIGFDESVGVEEVFTFDIEELKTTSMQQ